MSTRSTGVDRARDAAYAEFGRRHFKLIILMNSLGRAGGAIVTILVLLVVAVGGVWAYNRVQTYRTAHHPAPAVTTAAVPDPVTLPAPEPAAATAAGPALDWTALLFGIGSAMIAGALLAGAAVLFPGIYRSAGRKLVALAAALGAGFLVYLLKGAV